MYNIDIYIYSSFWRLLTRNAHLVTPSKSNVQIGQRLHQVLPVNRLKVQHNRNPSVPPFTSITARQAITCVFLTWLRWFRPVSSNSRLNKSLPLRAMAADTLADIRLAGSQVSPAQANPSCEPKPTEPGH